MKNLKKSALNVFDLTEEQKRILKLLLIKPKNEYQLWYTTKRYTIVNLQREALRNNIFGTKYNPEGLIKLGFIFPTKIKNSSSGKKSIHFNLTLKGLLACYEIESLLYDTNILKEYGNLLLKIIKDQKIIDLILDLIFYQINAFLLWHKVHGIQLTKLEFTNEYFSRLFEDNPALSNLINFSTYIENSKLKISTPEFIDYFASKNILYYLFETDKIPKIELVPAKKIDDDITLLTIPKKDRHKRLLYDLVFNWFNYIDELPKFNYNIDRLINDHWCKQYQVKDNSMEEQLIKLYDKRFEVLTRVRGLKITFPDQLKDDFKFKKSKTNHKIK